MPLIRDFLPTQNSQKQLYVRRGHGKKEQEGSLALASSTTALVKHLFVA